MRRFIPTTRWADGCSRSMSCGWGTPGSGCFPDRNDLIAISAMRCLSSWGVAVPDEISVTGFDNIRWTDLVTPRLTTIAQPVGAIGARAVELLLEQIEGKNVGST